MHSVEKYRLLFWFYYCACLIEYSDTHFVSDFLWYLLKSVVETMIIPYVKTEEINVNSWDPFRSWLLQSLASDLFQLIGTQDDS